MPKTVPLINTGKTFTLKTHSCLEKLRLVAKADNHKVPQFPKAQVYRLPIQVPGFPSETSIFPPKSFTPSSTFKVAQPSLLPPSITVKKSSTSHPHHPHPHLPDQPSSFHQLTVKEKPNFPSSSPSLLARTSTASSKTQQTSSAILLVVKIIGLPVVHRAQFVQRQNPTNSLYSKYHSPTPAKTFTPYITKSARYH